MLLSGEYCKYREPFADEEGIQHSRPAVQWSFDGRGSRGQVWSGSQQSMPGGFFHTVKLPQCQSQIDELHHLVATGHGRIEITCDGSSHACVLISKAELESLERALEILTETGDYQSMCQMISSIVSDCGGSPAAQSA
jgi:hypothetical protein